MLNPKLCFTVVILAVIASTVVGCGVSQEDYNAAVVAADAANAQVASLQSDLNKAERDLSKVQNELSEMQSQLESAEDDLSKEQSKYAAAQREISSLQSRISSLQSSLAEAEEEIAQLEAATPDLQSQVSSLQSQVSSLQNDLNKANNDLAAAEAEIARLKAATPKEGTQVGNLAPTFQLQDVDGKTVSLSNLRGKPVIINFWATWCGYCRNEMPYIQQIYDEYQNEGLRILAINSWETSAVAQNFMDSNNYSFTALIDTNGSVKQKYNVGGIPDTFFINKNGIIQARKIGAFPSKEAMKLMLWEGFID